ncbi:hypothetical protein H6P81_009224 [Aristolochia fimbriata]|uniref:Uncharacterized protein n=1 Tax=Aristolochia fimbriata TaxID=158543 RepID=A0AAV7ELK7_ARIFI|nr:hypothetical protein H6P81_009224 [Aristolochia fimbriata]
MAPRPLTKRKKQQTDRNQYWYILFAFDPDIKIDAVSSASAWLGLREVIAAIDRNAAYIIWWGALHEEVEGV